ncbi:unnamed protein product, partial [Adineta steineri]
IIIYAILNPLLGLYIDHVYNSTGTVRPAFFNTVAIQMTVICGIVFISTLIPKGAIACNPKLSQDENVDIIENPNISSDRNSDHGQVIKRNNQVDTGSELVTYF